MVVRTLTPAISQVFVAGAVLLALAGFGGTPVVPPRDGLLVDVAGVLDETREAALERELAATARFGYETAVVVVSGVRDRELLDYADDVLAGWRVGNPGRALVGVVLAVDAKSGQTAAASTDTENPGRFSLFLPAAFLVSDQVRAGDPAGAVETAVRRLRYTLGDPSVTPDPAWSVSSNSRESKRGSRVYVGLGILAMAVVVVVLSTSRTRSRALDEMVHAKFGRSRGGGGGGTYGDFR